jgi:hypothetical protein
MRKVLILTGLLAGCATVSHMTATSGSRADGIVKLSYEVGWLDKVAINEAEALGTARRRCSTWGYADAEAFGGITRQCQQSGSMGCLRWFVTKEYQCTSTANATAVRQIEGVQSAPYSPIPTSHRSTGVKLVPANTASGYCIEAPPGYQGTGSASAPAVTAGMPRC